MTERGRFLYNITSIAVNGQSLRGRLPNSPVYLLALVYIFILTTFKSTLLHLFAYIGLYHSRNQGSVRVGGLNFALTWGRPAPGSPGLLVALLMDNFLLPPTAKV